MTLLGDELIKKQERIKLEIYYIIAERSMHYIFVRKNVNFEIIQKKESTFFIIIK